ncbi:hypothetical protein NDU88_004846 [Pleurodeles waltl]|uniref:B30.2/SPRY domain-containing protein n=1 Tax=Pleurodeles waltl TaxID=8319 RepID=A0AAV7V461_PLEWA|nr:hypothetical protein NDU88_004846 [Pleurodeles waltl]
MVWSLRACHTFQGGAGENPAMYTPPAQHDAAMSWTTWRIPRGAGADRRGGRSAGHLLRPGRPGESQLPGGSYNVIAVYRDPEIPSYMDPEIPRYRDPEIPRYRDPEIPRCKKFQGPESEMKKKEKEVMITLKPEEEMKKYKVMVTLDPDTAHPELRLSEGGRRVRGTWTEQILVDTPKRFTFRDPCVLGNEGFTSGRYYWEVQVLGEPGEWGVGVAAESVERKRGITWSPEGGVWAVSGFYGEYTALTSPQTLLSPRDEPLNLGVYLDYEGGRLSLYNADSMELLYTFPRTPFSCRLFPFFCFWRGGAELRMV